MTHLPLVRQIMAAQPMRRNGQTKASTSPDTLSMTASEPVASKTHTSTHPPFATYRSLLPTALEATLLLLYPSTLLLGSLFAVLDPAARNAPYNPITQSHPPSAAPSYFAQKRNLFNVFFVKIGWFWTTLAFFIFLVAHPSSGPSLSPVLTPRRVRGMVRWAMVTLWWVLVTQWAFGPPLIDRNFRLTGGVCELAGTDEGREVLGAKTDYLTAAACKLAGGLWKGGHDISGHVFLLVLGSGFLWLEILPVVLRYAGLREKRLIRKVDGTVGNARAETQPMEDGDVDSFEAKGGLQAVLAVAVLSWWMLLMTAAYFHTWFEKVRTDLVRMTFKDLKRLTPGPVDGTHCSIHWNHHGILHTTSASEYESSGRHARALSIDPNCSPPISFEVCRVLKRVKPQEIDAWRPDT